jgi:hypothetical protein
MINATNKTIAFFMYLLTSGLSWIVLIINILLQLMSAFAMPVEMDILGFLMVTIAMSIYTFSLLFKIRDSAFAPIVFALLHLMTLHSGIILILLLIIDLIVLYLLNTTQPDTNLYNDNYQEHAYNYGKYQYEPKNQNMSEDNIFDAEYTTKKDEE